VYVREFVCALECALSSRPLDRRSSTAVDLLLAVSTMQRWLGEQGLLESEQPQQHGAALDPMRTFALHVQVCDLKSALM
jgi:hypothetical protein